MISSFLFSSSSLMAYLFFWTISSNFSADVLKEEAVFLKEALLVLS